MGYVIAGLGVLFLLAATAAIVVIGGRFKRDVNTPRERAVRWLAGGIGASVIALLLLSVAGIGFVSPFFFLVMLLALGALSLYWIDQLLDCVTSPPRHDDERIVWTLVVVFLPVVGAFLYQFVGRARLRPSEANDAEAENS